MKRRATRAKQQKNSKPHHGISTDEARLLERPRQQIICLTNVVLSNALPGFPPPDPTGPVWGADLDEV